MPRKGASHHQGRTKTGTTKKNPKPKVKCPVCGEEKRKDKMPAHLKKYIVWCTSGKIANKEHPDYASADQNAKEHTDYYYPSSSTFYNINKLFFCVSGLQNAPFWQRGPKKPPPCLWYIYPCLWQKFHF